ncbi:hypothetical protein D3C78_17780 [compost metagenome]
MPIIVGSLIYVLFRDSSLLVFVWLDAVGLTNLVESIRSNITFQLHPIILHSLPDGLWTYSFAYVMYIVWSNHKTPIRHIFISLAPFIGVSSEFGQLFGVVPGTFDIVDVFFYTLAGILVYTNLYFRERGIL